MLTADVVVAGAGPVGMLGALLAAHRGCKVLILEKTEIRERQSRAIGITPPSMGILAAVGLDGRFAECGVQVAAAAAHGVHGELGTVDLSRMSTPYSFVLAIPQHETERILEDAVCRNERITVVKGAEITGVYPDVDGCELKAIRPDGEQISAKGTYLLVCDGARSTVRTSLGIKRKGNSYPQTFLMGDFNDTTGWGMQARLYFTKYGSVESFPLPHGLRRFVVRTPRFIKEGTGTYLFDAIKQRCKLTFERKDLQWESAFGVQHYQAATFALQRIFLCGDAAHVMSPIGGQNMNTGFADTELAIWLINQMQEGVITAGKAADCYHTIRKRAAWHAQMRGAIMMYCGTSGGLLWNMVRNPLTALALRSPLSRLLNGMFTMMSIPCRDLASSMRYLPPGIAG